MSVPELSAVITLSDSPSLQGKRSGQGVSVRGQPVGKRAFWVNEEDGSRALDGGLGARTGRRQVGGCFLNLQTPLEWR